MFTDSFRVLQNENEEFRGLIQKKGTLIVFRYNACICYVEWVNQLDHISESTFFNTLCVGKWWWKKIREPKNETAIYQQLNHSKRVGRECTVDNGVELVL